MKMMREKIVGSIASAVEHLEKSMGALVKKDEGSMESSVWRAASDVEYSLFLFSLTQGEEPESSSGRSDLPSRQAEIGPILMLAQDLLKEAMGTIDAGDLREARKKTWAARVHLLKARELIEKRRKSGEKTTLPPP